MDNSDSSDRSAIRVDNIVRPDTSTIEINAGFPFGCVALTQLEYPMHWEGDLENYGRLKKPGEIEFEDLGQCFAALHSAKTIKLPNFHSREVLKIGDNFNGAYNKDSSTQYSIDSCRYRLPNIGIYECYYSYERYGNLLLLDKKTQNIKLLTIYADDLGGDSNTLLRYFLIDKNAINIYEGSCYDDGCNLDEKFRIIINQDGQINISPARK